MQPRNISKFYYKNLFIYSTPQFNGSMEKYFVSHTEKLVVFVIMPDSKEGFNMVRLYNKGLLVEEKRAWTSDNKFLYYASWYFYQIFFMLKYFTKDERFVLIGGHPLSFFGMWIQKLLRQVTFVYMIGDYFPTINTVYYLFQKLKEFYHGSIPYSFYLSDPVNKIMNESVLNTSNRKTIMWGVKPKKIERELSKAQHSMLFVGLIKENQGLELLFEFLRAHKEYILKIVGISHGDLYEKYTAMIKNLGISKQVYYPNRFFSDKDLNKISKECFVGVAPYLTGPMHGTYFVDPGKIKAYTEMQLPVIMSNTSSIAQYIKDFKAGEIIKRDVVSLHEALIKIRDNYSSYKAGVEAFNKHFFYETYYGEKFKFLENIV